MKPILAVQKLKVDFKINQKWVPVVEDLNFSVHESKVLGIVGESGCGKSVSLKALMGMVGFEGGKVISEQLQFKDIDLSRLSEKDWQALRGHKITMIFQDPMASFNPLERIGSQVVEVLLVHKICNKEKAKDKVLELFKEVGIPQPEKRFMQYPHEMSGGMLQRVVIAMALAPEPELILADEPTTALDVTLQKQILKLLKEIQTKRKTAMVFITHDLGVLKEIADDILVLYAGRQVEFLQANKLFTEAKHPYTLGLIKSLPNPFAPSELYSIPGRVESPAQRKAECHFASRCEKATEQCRAKFPEWKNWGDQHFGACYHA